MNSASASPSEALAVLDVVVDSGQVLAVVAALSTLLRRVPRSHGKRGSHDQ